MLKGRINKIPVAVGAGLLIFALLGSSILAAKMIGLLDKWTGNEQTQSQFKLTPKQEKSEVLPLVSLSAQARASKLEAIASGSKSLDQQRARYLLASDLIEQKQGKQALKWLEGLDTEYPVLASQIAVKRAQAYELMGDKGKAQEAWKAILTNYPTQPVAAEALYALGESNPEYWNQAIAKFQYSGLDSPKAYKASAATG